MSFGSPAKLERVERHLSRQRGAGVRTLVTNFGFSFGLPPASECAATRPDEPSPKRRKLIEVLHEEQRSAQTPRALKQEQAQRKGTVKHDVECEDNAQSTTKPKVRRRFDAIEEEAVVAAQQPSVDDSFTKTAKKRGQPRKAENAVKDTARVTKNPTKARTVRTTKQDVQQDTDSARVAEVVEVQPVRRPRRQAAASALIKVAEGFIEEAAPIDKKRRDPEPEKTVRRGRRKAEPLTDSVDFADHITSVAIIELEQTGGLKSKDEQPAGQRPEVERPNKRSRKKTEAAPHPTEFVVDKSTKGTALHTGPAAQKDQKGGHKLAASSMLSLKARRDDIPAPGTAQEHMDPEQLKQKPKYSIMNEPRSALQTLQRQPLRESHGNGILQSSPEKTSGSATSEGMEPKKYIAGSKSPDNSSSKRHALHATFEKEQSFFKPSTAKSHSIHAVDKKEAPQVDIVPCDSHVRGDLDAKRKTVERTKNTKVRNSARSKGVTKRLPQDPDVEVESIERPSTGSIKRQPAAKAKTGNRLTIGSKVGPKVDATSTGDEDVDWLFTSSRDNEIPMPTQKRRKASGKAKTSQVKVVEMDDMDLDDLLSNIATFANVTGTGTARRTARRG